MNVSSTWMFARDVIWLLADLGWDLLEMLGLEFEDVATCSSSVL
jgi:hypothetical protein